MTWHPQGNVSESVTQCGGERLTYTDATHLEKEKLHTPNNE